MTAEEGKVKFVQKYMVSIRSIWQCKPVAAGLSESSTEMKINV